MKFCPHVEVKSEVCNWHEQYSGRICDKYKMKALWNSVIKNSYAKDITRVFLEIYGGKVRKGDLTRF